jgi:hypothetical protein
MLCKHLGACSAYSWYALVSPFPPKLSSHTHASALLDRMVKKEHASKAAVKPKGMGGGGATRLGHSMDEKHRGKGAAGGMRDKGTVRRLMMYKQRPVRDSKGKVLKMDLQSRELPTTRIVPDRRWFGNTRVIGQAQLQQFRDDVGAKVPLPLPLLLTTGFRCSLRAPPPAACTPLSATHASYGGPCNACFVSMSCKPDAFL